MASCDQPRCQSCEYTDIAVEDRSSPGYDGDAICFCSDGDRTSNVPVLPFAFSPLEVEPEPRVFLGNPFTASHRASGSMVSPLHAALTVTFCGMAERPRSSFVWSGQFN